MAFSQVNAKVVSTPVAPGQEVLARRGAMLAYTGDVGFTPVHMALGRAAPAAWSGGWSRASRCR